MLKSIELSGFKSFAKPTKLDFRHPVSAIVGPNGSGKSNCAEAFRFVLGEQSVKSMRGKKNEDLIFNGSGNQPRSNRAAVKIVFDNSKRLLDLDFDDVIIERVVHRDGTNSYLINGSEVRLKDIAEMLAMANIGSTGHHIISQGEADRILSVSPRERKAMVEDALGLKKYLYKKNESEKKLDKTEINIHEIESLRREIKPELNYLKKQVSKIEFIKQIKDELFGGFRSYLAHEDHYIRHAQQKLENDRLDPHARKKDLDHELAQAQKTLARSKEDNPFKDRVVVLEGETSILRQRKDELAREIGRIEGEIKAEERLIQKEEERQKGQTHVSVPKDVIDQFKGEMETLSGRGQGLFDVGMLKDLIKTIHSHVTSFFDAFDMSNRIGINIDEAKRSIETLVDTKKTLTDQFDRALQEEKHLTAELFETKNTEREHNEKFHDAEKRVLEIRAELKDVDNTLSRIELLKNQLENDKALFNEDMKEIGFLLGTHVLRFEDVVLTDRSREHQREERRNLERKKIKFEEAGVGDHAEVIKQYEALFERDQFLEREIEDLYRTKSSLVDLIEELTHKLDTEFQTGVTRINGFFGDFFRSMFGAGDAELAINEYKKDSEGEDAPEIEYGLDVFVNLPHKKIKGLEMLSGGERALTSIALLFALSQLNPPPFIILDETDAALDEANSRKYGDMIEGLAKRSQLVVITHNRETMSRAGLLYGVTMGGDGISKILSVEFEDALSVAK